MKNFAKNHPAICIGIVFFIVLLSLNLLAALTNTYDVSTPGGQDDPREADDRMREIKASVQERMNDHNGYTDEGDHYWPLDGTEVSDNDTGQHRMVTLRQLSDDPDTLTSYADLTDLGFLYQKDESGNGELFWEDESANVLQLTSGGYTNGAILLADSVAAASIEFTNNTYLTQKDSGGTARNVVGMDGSNIIQVGNATTTDVRLVTATASATANDRQVADKGYVDTQVATKGYFAANVTIVAGVSIGDTNWHEYDLSGTVGSNSALCIFSVTVATAYSVGVRPAGGDDYDFTNSAASANIYNPGLGGEGGILMSPCSSAGLIDYKCANGGGSTLVTLKLIGYIL